MRKFIQRLIIVLAALLGTLLLAVIVILSFFEKQIGNQLIQTINSGLETELQVKDFDLTFLTSFPNASIELSGVSVADRFGSELLNANTLAFQFKLFSLFGSNIKVSSVVAEEGILAIHFNEKSDANFDIFKSQEGDSSPSEMQISLKEARLKNVLLDYRHQATKQSTELNLDEVVMRGNFSTAQFKLEAKANLHSQFLKIGQDDFLVDKPIRLDTKLEMDLSKGNYVLDRMYLTIAKSRFDVDGSIKVGDGYTDFDLIARNNRGNLENILSLLPPKYLQYLGDFKSRGELYFNGLIKGRLSKRENPAIDIEFGLRNAVVSSPKLIRPLENVTLTTHFNNGNDRNYGTSIFEVQELRGDFGAHELTAQLIAEDLRLDRMRINAGMNGTLPLANIYKLFRNEKLKGGTGLVHIDALKLNGFYQDMISTSRIPRVDIMGNIRFEEAGLTINKEDLVLNEGILRMNDNELTVTNCKVKGAGSDFQLNGTCYNLLPVLFADSLNSSQAKLEFVSTLDATNLDLDRLVGMTLADTTQIQSSEAVDSIKTEAIEQREAITNFLDGVIKIDVDSFNYNRINGTAFVGKVRLQNSQMNIAGDTDAMNGTFAVDGTLFFTKTPYLTARLQSKTVSLQQFFYESNNFTQAVITDQHLRGQLNARLSIAAYWDEEMNFLFDRLSVLGELEVTDGEMNDFELFKNFSSFVHEESLQRVRFADMKNWFEIRSRKLFIPVMFVQTNAVNITLSGDYSFNYDYDFNIKVNAGQVLATKMKRQNKKITFLPSKRKGWFNLYYKVYGQGEDFKYEMAKREIKKDFERSERRKNRIQRSLEREFGNVVLLQEPPAWLDDAQYFNATDEELEFLFEEAIEGGSAGNK